MGQTSTQSAKMKQWLLILLHFYLITLLSSSSYAQTKIFANTATVVSTRVDDKDNATRDDNTFASVKSYGGAALGIGRYSGELQLSYAQDVDANRTTFIRIGYDANILNALLGGNLGSSLAGLLGNVVLGDHYFVVGAKNSNGQEVAVGSSNGSFSTSNVKLVRDAAGNFYLAVTPNAAYRSVFIKDVTNALLLSSPNEIRVYNAFHVSGTGNCDPPFATDYEGTGATLSLLGAGGAGVTNIQNAIDGNPATNSNISLGLISAVGTISQNIYFNSPSRVNDEFNIRLRVSAALANVGVLSNITVEAYNGNNLVYNRTGLAGLLNLDLLGLLNGGQAVNIPFSPNAIFDRVKITLSALLGVSLTQSIDVFEVNRSAPRPTFAAPLSNALNICYNSTATLAATTASTNELVWYDVQDGGTALATTAYNTSFTTPALTASKTYYVAARQLGCTAESVRVPINVTVNPQINFAATALNNATIGTAYSKQLTAATGGTAAYTYAVAAGSTLPAGLTLSNAGLLAGMPTQAGSFTFSITVTDAKGCTATASHTLTVTNTLTLGNLVLPDGTVGLIYPTQVVPAANGGSTPYTYTAINLPAGLTFNPTTREITGTPTVAGSFVITVNVSDADGNAASINYPIVIKNALALASTSLAVGTVGASYPSQTLPAATGGTPGYTYVASNVPPGLTFNPTTREISGVPTTVGNFTVSVQVSDAAGSTVSTDYTIRVIAPLTLANKTLANGTVGATYATETLPAASGGTGPYTYVATNVPAGLSFNANTREITGTPTGAGNFSITLTVTDAEGRTATNTYALSVTGALNLATASLPNGTVGTAYPVQTLPAVTGGTAPYTYTAINLPAGLTFNPATRELSGTPTLGGNYTFSINATDAANNSVTTNYQVNVTVPAPVVASAITCSGTSTTLTVGNTQSGITYNWYGASGSTALATNNNGTFNTGNITASTVFYVEAVSGTAVSARVAVNVTANPAPNSAVITTNNQTINANQTTTLRATADVGNTIRWYDAVTGGTLLATGEEFTTANLAATTTFYAEAVSAQGCASLTKTPAVVTVINGGAGANCTAANAQSSGITGLLCVLCNVANPGNAVDADPNNYTRITLTVGAASTGFQRLVFPTMGLATDSIRLDLATPTGLLDLSALGGITVNVMKNNTVVRTLQLNSSLVYLQLLGGNRFEATFAAGAEFDRVEVRFQAVVAALSSLDIYGAQIVYPNPTVVGNNQTICYNTSATISATANGSTQIAWYDAATGGNLLATTASFTTPNLTASTIYYIEVSRNGCANTSRMPISVNVVPLLAVPTVAASSLTACESSPVTLAVASPNPAVTYKWYDAAVGGTELFTGATYTISNISASKTYYVEATQQGCVSAGRAAVAVTVNPRPVLPQVQASVSTINAGQTVVLTASSTDTDVEFNWYTSANAATPVFTGATFVTPPLATTTSYYVEARSSVTGCVSPSRVMITINVNNAGAIPTPCISPIAESNGVSGIALLAGVSNSALAIDNDTQTGSTLYLPVAALGGYVYQRFTFPGEGAVGDTVRIAVSSPGKLLSLGVLGSVQLATLKAGVANNDLTNLNSALISLELLSGGTQALLTFVPAQTFDQVELRLNAGVASALNTVNVNYAQHVIAAPQVSAANVTTCNGASANLTVQNPRLGFTYKWYNEAGVYQADGVTFTTPNITATTKFYVTASSGSGCESSRTAVEVSLKPIPAAPVLLSDNISTCTGSNVVLQVKDPIAGLTYRWYNASNVQVATGTSYQVNNVTANATFSVEAFDADCNITSATKTNVQINVGTLDAPVVTTANVSVTSGARALLNAVSSNPAAIIRWYDQPVGGTLLQTGNSYLTNPITANTTFYVEAFVNGGCASVRIPVTVTVVTDGNTGPVPCLSATIAVDKGTVGVALLSDVFNPQLAVDDRIETASSLVIPAGLANAYVYQRVGFGSLSTIGDTVKVRITSPGKLLSLSVLPSISVLTYNGTNSNNDAITANSSLINLELLSDGSAATLTFVPTQQFDAVELHLNSGLVSAFNSLNFNYAQRIGVAPQVDVAAVTACAGGSAVLSVKNPVLGTTYRWYLNNTGTATEGANFTTPNNLAAGTYNYYVRAVVNGCESAGTKVEVTILPVPAPPVPLNTNPTNICFGASAALGVESVAGVSFNWYNANGTLVALNTSTYTIPANLPVGSYTYTVEATNANSCANTTRTSITINIGERAVANDIMVVGADICASNAATLTASSTTVTNPQFKWYADAALTIPLATTATYTTPVINSSVTYYVTVSGSNKCENLPMDAKAVTINVNPPATASDLMVSPAVEICGTASVSLTASSATVANPVFTWYTDAALTTVAGTGSPFVTPVLTASQTYYVTVKGDNRCESPASQAKAVVVTVKANALASDITVNGNRNVCLNSSTVLNATTTTVSNPIFTWYEDAALTTIAFVGTPFTTPNLNANKTYYVTVKGADKCENQPANALRIDINVNNRASAADLTVSTPNELCGPGAVTITASSTTVTNPVFTWYSDANLTTVAATGSSFTTPTLAASQTYYVTVKGDNRCETPASDAKVVTVIVKPFATNADLAVAPSTTEICGSGTATFTASSNTVTNPMFTWYSNAALTNVAFVGASFTTPTLSTNQTYYVTVKGDNRCETPAADARAVTVTIKQRALASDMTINGNTTICANGTTTLTASSTTVTNPIFTWYSNAALTTVVNVGPGFTTPVLSANQTYYVTVKGDNRCENAVGTAASININVAAAPVAPIVASTGTTICSNNATVLTVSNVQANTVYEWYNSANNGTLLFTGSSYTTPVSNSNTTYYVQAVATSGCTTASARTAVAVTVNARPANPTVASTTVSTCTNSTATLTISSPVAGVTYTWFTSAMGGTAVGTGSIFTTPPLSANAVYYVEASAGSCASSGRTQVNVTVGVPPAPPANVTAAATSICAGSTTVLTVNNPVAGVTYNWYSAETGGTSLHSGVTYTTMPLNVTTTYYVEAVANGGNCVSVSRTAVIVNVLSVLPAPVVTVGNVTTSSIQFNWNAVTGASVYEVSMDGGNNWVTTVVPNYLAAGLNQGQSITVVVRAKAVSACQTSANSNAVTASTTEPFKDELYIPNTFTPNNDGRNDFFMAYGNNVAKFRMRVYNQWGEFIYESQNLLQGWDGTYRGRQQPSGVYVYYIDVTFNSGVTKTFKGTVTLLR
ncbi:putative Ig domain-containing protein [Nubsella zeaxanthinifaciens]|uniref:Ig-like domain-containing protein n=1 Tax=Nubsella zeaxanthinifaciens TaxID=392412 RepID=UPI000DE25520|nr:putative Ig domain-containing protein [Nubsella zeaxanthinifaciens]